MTSEGENFHKFRSLVAIFESFLRETWGCSTLWHDKNKQSAKLFSVKIVFFTNSRKFSPSKEVPAIRYFDRVTAFKALYCKTFVKARAHTHSIDVHV